MSNSYQCFHSLVEEHAARGGISFDEGVELARRAPHLKELQEKPVDGVRLFHEFQASSATYYADGERVIDPQKLDQLIASSAADHDAFCVLSILAAQSLEGNLTAPTELTGWSVRRLRGEIKEPARRRARHRWSNRPRDFAIATVFHSLTKAGLKPSRNRATHPDSAADALSIVLNELGHPMSADAVLKVWAKFAHLR